MCLSPTSVTWTLTLLSLWIFMLPDCGKSSAIAAAPMVTALPSVKANKVDVRDASNFPLHDKSLIVSEQPAFLGSPALDASQRQRSIEVRPKYHLRRALLGAEAKFIATEMPSTVKPSLPFRNFLSCSDLAGGDLPR
jgi:hypothetical protein